MKAFEYAKLDKGITEVNPKGCQNWNFSNNDFKQAITNVGWRQGQAYCAYAVIKWLRQAGDSRVRFMNASTVSSYQQFKKHLPAQVHDIPAVNAIVIWQKAGTPYGHTGIVTEVLADGTFRTIEGNTSVRSGTEREGDGIGEKMRSLKPMGGLEILGFIYEA